MAVRVLFFGATAEISGTRTVEIEPAEGSTAATVLESLAAAYPALGTSNLKISINQKYASGDEGVRDGDEVAVFTAVSGG